MRRRSAECALGRARRVERVTSWPCSCWGSAPHAALASASSGGGQLAGPLKHWLIFGVVVGLALLLTALARHMRPTIEATVLALAAGLLYGLQDSLTRITGQFVDTGGVAMIIIHWQPYVVVV